MKICRRRSRIAAELRDGLPRAEQFGQMGFTTEQIAQAMESAGIDPRMVYAFRKTGFIPSEANVGLFDEAELAEWDAAITEYETQHLTGAAGGGR